MLLVLFLGSSGAVFADNPNYICGYNCGAFSCSFTFNYYIDPANYGSPTDRPSTITDLTTGRTIQNGQSETFSWRSNTNCNNTPGIEIRANILNDSGYTFHYWSLSGASYVSGSSSSNPISLEGNSGGSSADINLHYQTSTFDPYLPASYNGGPCGTYKGSLTVNWLMPAPTAYASTIWSFPSEIELNNLGNCLSLSFQFIQVFITDVSNPSIGTFQLGYCYNAYSYVSCDPYPPNSNTGDSPQTPFYVCDNSGNNCKLFYFNGGDQVSIEVNVCYAQNLDGCYYGPYQFLTASLGTTIP